MNLSPWYRVPLLGIFLLFLCSASWAEQNPSNGKIKTFVSILPQAYFVKRIGGSLVNVEVLVGPGQSHETYEPSPRQMVALAETQIYFRIGLPFEDQLLKKIIASHENLKVIDTRDHVPLHPMEDSPTEEGHNHGVGIPDPHIWLDPSLVQIQGRTICNALKEIDPVHASEYEENLSRFISDLETINAKNAKILAPYKGKEFFVFHPAFGYFARAYGLEQVAVETGGREPSPKQLATLINRAKQERVKVIFVQPQFSSKSAQTIAKAIGGIVIPIDPMDKDYLKNLETISGKINEALR